MNSELEARICSLSDKDLVKMLRTPQEYRAEALEFARAEVNRRGGLDVVEEVAEPEIREETERKNVGKVKLAMALAVIPAVLITAIIVAIPVMLLDSVLPDGGHKWVAVAVAFAIISLFLLVWTVVGRLIAKKIGVKDITTGSAVNQ